jgi:hypothetical protein
MARGAVRRAVCVVATLGTALGAASVVALPAGANPPVTSVAFPSGDLFDVSEHGNVVGYNDYAYRDLRTGAEFTVGTGPAAVVGDGRFVINTFDVDHGATGVRVEITDRSATTAPKKILELSQVGNQVEQIYGSENGEVVAINTNDGMHHWLTVWNTRTGATNRVGESLPRTAENWGPGRTDLTLVTDNGGGSPAESEGFGAVAVSGNGQVVAYFRAPVGGTTTLYVFDRVSRQTEVISTAVLPWRWPSPYRLLYLDRTGNRVGFLERRPVPWLAGEYTRASVWDRADRKHLDGWPPFEVLGWDGSFEAKSFAMSSDGRTIVYAPYRQSNPGVSYIVTLPLSAGGANIEAGQTVEIAVTGAAGVPADATAVALNVTAVGADAAGYLTVWPCGLPQPTASNLNFAAREDTANLVLSKVGTAGRVCVYSSRNANLLVDLAGFFPVGADYVGISPVRSKPTDGATVEVRVTSPAIPANAGAVVLNLTATATTRDGFVTAWPCGEERPVASSLNFRAERDRANLVVAKVGPSGAVCLNTSSSAHLIADVAGYFPAGPSFVPLTPNRILDTRSAAAIEAGGATEFAAPVGAKAVALNLTATRTAAAGYATVWPCGEPRPVASHLNYAASASVASGVIARVGANGKVCVYTDKRSDLIVDVNGMFPAASSYVPITAVRVYDSRMSL